MLNLNFNSFLTKQSILQFDDVEIFKKLSDLGSELIEVHLLKKTPESSIGIAKTTDKNFDYTCQKPIFKTQSICLIS